MKKTVLTKAARIMLILAFLFFMLVAAVAWDAHRFLSRPLSISQSQLIELPSGTNLRTLTNRLMAHGAITKPRYKLYLDWYARVHGLARRLKAGEYQIRPGMTAVDLLNTVVKGKVYQHSVTIIDGWTFQQMMSALNKQPALKHLLRGDTKKQVMAAIGHPDQPAQGHFLPNTYYFTRGMTDIAFLKRAYHAMQVVLKRQWKKRAKGLPLKNKDQALTLASLIEKESGDPNELGKISGVFIRRLEKGMKLETDPTVIYGLGSSYNGKLTREDLRKDTPYNTYTHYGLPPTPICMPSKAALHAALHPTPGKALYFVSKGNGTHHFSDTFAAHKRAIRKYEFNNQ